MQKQGDHGEVVEASGCERSAAQVGLMRKQGELPGRAWGQLPESWLSSQVDAGMGTRPKAGRALGPECSISWSSGALEAQPISRRRC